MPIESTDIQSRLSGGAANTNPAASIGGAISNTSLVDATLNNLFTEVNEDQTEAGVILYRCFYVRNAHGTLTWKNVKVWIQTQSTSEDTVVAIGLGASAVNGTETAVANQTTAPGGVSFTAPADKASGLVIGDLAPGAHKAVWVRLTVTAGAAAANDSCVIRSSGGTAA
jgi:hypothetical protein